MFAPSFLHITSLYIFTSLHTHQYLFMRALYIYIFFLSDIFISFPLSYVSRYTPLRSRAIRRLVFWLCAPIPPPPPPPHNLLTHAQLNHTQLTRTLLPHTHTTCRQSGGREAIWENENNCTPLQRGADFKVKRCKARHSRSMFWSSGVEKAHALLARNTCRSQNVQKHTNFGAGLEVENSKSEGFSQNCSVFWCQVQQNEDVSHNNFIFKLADTQVQRSR